MPDLLTLTCPTCGAKLKITEQIHLLVCQNCGNEHMVMRDGGAMYLAPLAQDMRGIRVGVDKTAAELAVVRLVKEIQELEEQRLVVLGRKDESWVEVPPNYILVSYLNLLILAAAIISCLVSNWSLGLILFATMIPVQVYLSKADSERKQKIDALLEEEVGKFDKLLDSKNEQLRRNRQIADS